MINRIWLLILLSGVVVMVACAATSKFWCLELRADPGGVTNSGECYRTQPECESKRNRYRAGGGSVEPCVEASEAHCFIVQEVYELCFDTAGECSKELRRHKDLNEPLTFSSCELRVAGRYPAPPDGMLASE
ncbi:hypothetical protein [Haliangium sp.]